MRGCPRSRRLAAIEIRVEVTCDAPICGAKRVSPSPSHEPCPHSPGVCRLGLWKAVQPALSWRVVRDATPPPPASFVWIDEIREMFDEIFESRNFLKKNLKAF